MVVAVGEGAVIGKSPVSATLIVKDDRAVFDAIRSVSPYVSETIVGWTPNDVVTEAALLEAGATRVVEIPGPVHDWAAARNRTMEFASQPWVMWLDSDDTVEGIERLPEALALLEQHPLARLLCPYDYATDPETGAVTCRQ